MYFCGMDAKEIRIGNLVLWNGKEHEVLLLDFKEETFKEFHRIPLTEQWLVKFGFISNPYSDRYEKDSFRIEHNAERGYSIFWHDKTGVSLENVHQLQNLYFALTGEELIIKQ